MGTVKITKKSDCVKIQGYPQLSVADGVTTITDKFCVVGVTALLDAIPPYGSNFVSDDDFFAKYSYCRLTRLQVVPQVKGTYEVTLTYEREAEEYDDPDAMVRVEVSYSPSNMEVGLESCENYRTIWDHHLAIKKDGAASETVPAWVTSATDTALLEAPAESRVDYKWIGKSETIPDAYIVIAACTKPEVENRLVIRKEVNVVKRCTNLRKLVRDASKDGCIQTPPETFGLVGEWLRTASPIQKNGRYWEIHENFIFSQEIDRDIYHE